MIVSTAETEQVWLTHVNESSGERVAKYKEILSDEEREKANRFIFDKDRILYLAAHAHLRQVLSHYEDIPPSEWKFRTTPLGRPYISNRVASAPLYFSLSHTSGMVVSVVSGAEQCGIDVETLDRVSDCVDIARHYFTAPEYKSLEQLSGEQLRRHFVKLWTLKEAYAKATGIGLSASLNTFSLSIDEDPIKVIFKDSLNDEARKWSFMLLRPTPGHHIGLALRSETGRKINPLMREMEL